MHEVLLPAFICLPASPVGSCLYVSILASNNHLLPCRMVFVLHAGDVDPPKQRSAQAWASANRMQLLCTILASSLWSTPLLMPDKVWEGLPTFICCPAPPLGSCPYASILASSVHLLPTTLAAFFLKAGGVCCTMSDWKTKP